MSRLVVMIWLLAGASAAWGQPAVQGGGPRPEAGGTTGSRTPGDFRKAGGTRSWSFPRDHGQHPQYLLEWWYYTGVVATKTGREFGYQVTFFRKGLPTPPGRSSAWVARSLYMAHLAVSDLSAKRFWQQGLWGREALGLAGAELERQRVWLHSWRAEPLADDPHGVLLEAKAKDFALSLHLRTTRGPVLHGEQGLDRKGVMAGQATWYYSLTDLHTEGTLTLEGTEFRVRGGSWMDHEFGTNQLAPEQVGWDWFGLRLEDGRGLMVYRLRVAGGKAHPSSGGTLVTPSGETVRLLLTPENPGTQTRTQSATPAAPSPDDGTTPLRASLTPVRWWRSPASGGNYPVGWELKIPAQGLRLTVEAAFPGQELTPGPGIPFPYWEGVVKVKGRSTGHPVSGNGYMELTGYAGGLAEFFR